MACSTGRNRLCTRTGWPVRVVSHIQRALRSRIGANRPPVSLLLLHRVGLEPMEYLWRFASAVVAKRNGRNLDISEARCASCQASISPRQKRQDSAPASMMALPVVAPEHRQTPRWLTQPGVAGRHQSPSNSARTNSSPTRPRGQAPPASRDIRSALGRYRAAVPASPPDSSARPRAAKERVVVHRCDFYRRTGQTMRPPAATCPLHWIT